MALVKNVSNGGVFFGRFKLKAGDTVPAVEYTEAEQKDIKRFIEKGILAYEGTVAEPVEVTKSAEEAVVVAEEAVEVAEVTEVVEETHEATEEPAKRGRKKA